MESSNPFDKWSYYRLASTHLFLPGLGNVSENLPGILLAAKTIGKSNNKNNKDNDNDDSDNDHDHDNDTDIDNDDIDNDNNSDSDNDHDRDNDNDNVNDNTTEKKRDALFKNRIRSTIDRQIQINAK